MRAEWAGKWIQGIIQYGTDRAGQWAECVFTDGRMTRVRIYEITIWKM
jgi:hypothetical protein